MEVGNNCVSLSSTVILLPVGSAIFDRRQSPLADDMGFTHARERREQNSYVCIIIYLTVILAGCKGSVS